MCRISSEIVLTGTLEDHFDCPRPGECAPFGSGAQYSYVPMPLVQRQTL